MFNQRFSEPVWASMQILTLASRRRSGAWAVAAVLLLAASARGQELDASPPIVHSPESYQLGHSPLNQPAAVAQTEMPVSPHFLIPVGSGGFNVSTGLKTEYVDNVYLTHTDTKDDFILIPECDLGSYFPVGQRNSLAVDVGLAYYEYVKNSALNTGVPLINPNTDLAFKLYAGDFKFDFSERFSYQQSPLYETGSEFFNLYNTALFQRYQNQAGGLVTWDQNKLVTTAGYFHENLWSESSVYSFIDHASELFNANSMLTTSPGLKVGIEATGSINDFFNSPSYDTWRARVGPALRVTPSEFISIRAGGGYERIQYDSAEASTLGLVPQNTYYAYGSVEHQITQFLRHSLTVSHDNQLGFNAANLEGTTVSYSLTWLPRKQLTLSPFGSINFYDESYSSSNNNLYHEKFTFYYVGLNAHYQLGPHWSAGAGWNYRLKNSDITIDGYAQNEVSLELLYQF